VGNNFCVPRPQFFDSFLVTPKNHPGGGIKRKTHIPPGTLWLFLLCSGDCGQFPPTNCGSPFPRFAPLFPPLNLRGPLRQLPPFFFDQPSTWGVLYNNPFHKTCWGPGVFLCQFGPPCWTLCGLSYIPMLFVWAL